MKQHRTVPFTTTPAPIAYRADIDGLRAIAVLLVLAYHAFPKLVPGGFVGVDLFFVISGYLITGILLKEHHAQQFSILRFYQRRILRLFPSLSLVLFTGLLYGWYTLMASELAQLGTLTAASTGFVVNEILRQQSGYFDLTASTKPLLHLWSLGIEEQFYLFWPAILALSLRYSPPKQIYKILIGLWLSSFFLNVYWVHQYPENVFYSIPTRFWELLSGGLLAQWQQTHAPTGLSKKQQSLLSTLALLLLILPVTLLTPNSAFPGTWALLPVVSAVIILVLNSNTWLNRLLARTPLVQIGLISYPLYLWHWPLLVFVRQAEFGYSSTISRILTLGVSMVLAGLSYHFLEKPIRSQRFSRTHSTSILIIIMLVIGIFGETIHLQSGFPQRPLASHYADVDDASGDWDYPGIGFDGQHLETHTIKGNSSELIVFLGDSHMEQYWPRIKALYKNSPKHYTVLFATYEGCPFLPGLNRPTAPDFPAGGCAKVYLAALRSANQPQVKGIVIGNYWEHYQSWPHFFQSMHALSQQLLLWHRHGIRTYLIASNPAGRSYIPQNHVQRLPFIRIPPLDPPRFLIENPMQITRPLVYILAQYSHSRWIDPLDDLCDRHTCSTDDEDNIPINKDADHLRSGWVEDKADFIDETVLP